MRLDKNRYFIILRTLMHHRETYCTSERLAHDAMVSVRSIKNDLSYLNDELMQDGYGSIDAKKSKGYKLVFHDEAACQEISELIHVHQLLFHNISIESMNRRLHIVQSLLAHSYTKIDDLADTLYTSRSSLAKDNAWATRFLKSYGLDVRAVPGKGLHVIGDEYMKRVAMVEVYCSQYHELDLLYPVEAFVGMFDDALYEDIRHEMLSVIRATRLTISDIATKKIATYLCLINHRSEYDYGARTEALKTELMDSYEYHIAQDIFALPIIHDNIAYREDDILTLTRQLLANKDINLRDAATPCSQPLLDHADQLYQSLCHRMTDEGVVLFTSSFMHTYEKDLKSLLVRLLLRHRYDSLQRYQLITYTDSGELNVSPLALELTRLTLNFLQNALQTAIYGGEVDALSQFYHHVLNAIHVDYHKQRLAVFAMEGLTIAELMKDALMKRYGPYIEKIDTFNLYEMRRIDFHDYDATIASWNVAYYRYPIPLVVCEGYDRHTDAHQLFNQLFINGYSMALRDHLTDITQCVKDVDVEDYDMMIHLAAQTYAKDEGLIDAMVRKARERYKSLSYYNPDSGIAMIFLDYEDTHQDVFTIYKPKKTVFWDLSFEIRYFVVVCMHRDMSLSELALYNHLLQLIFMNRRYVRQMYDDLQKTWHTLYYHVLETIWL